MAPLANPDAQRRIGLLVERRRRSAIADEDCPWSQSTKSVSSGERTRAAPRSTQARARYDPAIRTLAPQVAFLRGYLA